MGGETLFSKKGKFTQTDGNEYIDSLNDGYMDYGATTAHRFATGNLGIGVTPSYKFSVGSTDNSDQIGIHHDNTDAYIVWDDGTLNLQSVENNANFAVNILGTGTGLGHLQITGEMKCRVYSQAAKPNLAADNRFAFWIDTDDSNKVYLIFRRASGDNVTVLLT